MGSGFKDWIQRKFSQPQALVLLTLLLAGALLIYTFGRLLAPILVAIVFAYLLDWGVRVLCRRGIPRLFAVIGVFILFVGLSALLIFGLLPLVWSQLENLAAEVPHMVTQGQELLTRLPEQYPAFITLDNIHDINAEIGAELGNLGKYILSVSLSSLFNVAAIAIYMILVPLMVFFFLKDKEELVTWVVQHLPRQRALANRVWQEVDVQIGNYIRGKLLEILIVGIATYLVFVVTGMNFALLLGVLVGLSVLIPYIGAAVVTIPVFVIAYLQWGWSADLGYLVVAYLVVQALDGNLLVPLLFSEAVSLHPVAIIGAVLIFGGLWGFWGVFFAIPLATLVKALINAWEEGGTVDIHTELNAGSQAAR